MFLYFVFIVYLKDPEKCSGGDTVSGNIWVVGDCGHPEVGKYTSEGYI